jgi:PAS domain S-box-containing protein
VRILVANTNITARKRVEDELRASEARFHLLVDSVQDYAIFMLDPDGRVLTWNSGAERLYGYRASEIVGQSSACFYVPQDVAAGTPEQTLRCALAEGHAEDEGWRVRKDGLRFWANMVMTALWNEHGGLAGFAKITRDLSARRQAETEQKRLLHVLESSLNEIYVFDAETLLFEYVNHGARRNLGYSIEELRGMTPPDLNLEFSATSFRDVLGPLLRRELEKHVFHTVHRRADQSLYNEP